MSESRFRDPSACSQALKNGQSANTQLVNVAHIISPATASTPPPPRSYSAPAAPHLASSAPPYQARQSPALAMRIVSPRHGGPLWKATPRAVAALQDHPRRSAPDRSAR